MFLIDNHVTMEQAAYMIQQYIKIHKSVHIVILAPQTPHQIELFEKAYNIAATFFGQ